eukprot:SAG31_NODE_36_length_31714_cov_61.379598_2_plen_102_part_00
MLSCDAISDVELLECSSTWCAALTVIFSAAWSNIFSLLLMSTVLPWAVVPREVTRIESMPFIVTLGADAVKLRPAWTASACWEDKVAENPLAKMSLLLVIA